MQYPHFLPPFTFFLYILTTTCKHTSPKVYLHDRSRATDMGTVFFFFSPIFKNLLCALMNSVCCVYVQLAGSLCVCVCIQTMHSVDSPQRCAFLLGEYMSSGVVPPSMTSGEAIIFCINDEQQPAMREMDFVLGRSTADYGQQQCWQK